MKIPAACERFPVETGWLQSARQRWTRSRPSSPTRCGGFVLRDGDVVAAGAARNIFNPFAADHRIARTTRSYGSLEACFSYNAHLHRVW